jgi:hypothetical protein
MHRTTGAVPTAGEAVSAIAVGPTRTEQETERRSPTRARVVDAFEAAIADALGAAAMVERQPIESVHEFRRATRRARAILAAVGERLGTTARLEMTSALRSAIRDTSEMRDRDVLPVTLAALPPRDGTEEARAELETALLVDRQRQRRPLSRVRLIAVAAARLGLLPDRFEAELAADVADGDLALGFKKLARKARRDVRAAIEKPEDLETTHAARKRVRRLAAALDALLGRRSRPARLAKALQKVSSKLGDTLDLERLAQVARAKGDAEGDKAHARLLEQIDRRPLRRRPELLEQAEGLLKRRRWKPARLLRTQAS